MESDAHAALTGIAVVALAALACGMVLERLRQPAIVGYIIAGVLLGPSGLGMVEDRSGIDSLAELGVLMLLFLIGMELSLRAFRRVWLLALGTTVVQIVASVGVMLLCARVLDWTLPAAILFGFVIALSSTAVAVKILESLGELRRRTGRIAVGVLIAQDLAVVPMMITINALGGDTVDWLVAPKIVLSVAFLVGLILFLSGGRKVELPFSKIVAGHADLVPLTALGFCFGLAALSGLLGLSAAYGAFLAGLIIGNSTDRQSMITATQPIQSVLMMVFFLSVGLLIDLDYIWSHLTLVLSLFVLIAVFKTAINVITLGVLGQAWHHAFLAGIMISQVGEFSFLLAVIAADSGIISAEESRLVVAVTVMSLALSPFWVITGRRLQLLASYGVTEGRELIKLVYGPEVEMVSEVIDGARTTSQRQLRIAALWLRRRRLKWKREQQAKKEASRPGPPAEGAAPPEQPAKAEAAVEVIPPAKNDKSDPVQAPADDAVEIEPEPEETKKPVRRTRKRKPAAKARQSKPRSTAAKTGTARRTPRKPRGRGKNA